MTDQAVPTGDLTVTGGVIHLPGGRVHRVRPEGRVEIPVALAHLDVDPVSGVAVPAVAPRVPGTDEVDEPRMREKIAQALLHRTCAMCGLELPYRFCFHVSTAPDGRPDDARAARYVTAPGMHVADCSPYAAAAYGASTDPDRAWWRYTTRSYEVEWDGPWVRAKAAPATLIERL